MTTFTDSFSLTSISQNNQEKYLDQPFFEDKIGAVYENGLYTVLTKAQSQANKTILEKCGISNVYSDTIIFGKDWFGRLYGISQSFPNKVFLYDLVDTEVYSAVGDVEFFHNVVLSEDEKAALEYDLFLEWYEKTQYELLENECISLKHPYFMGGDYYFENLEVSDMEVTWSVNSQLVEGF